MVRPQDAIDEPVDPIAENRRPHTTVRQQRQQGLRSRIERNRRQKGVQLFFSDADETELAGETDARADPACLPVRLQARQASVRQ